MEDKEYYTVEEVKEMGVPRSTLLNWLYTTRVAEEKEFTEVVKKLVIPKSVIEKWSRYRRVRADEV